MSLEWIDLSKLPQQNGYISVPVSWLDQGSTDGHPRYVVRWDYVRLPSPTSAEKVEDELSNTVD